MNKILQVIAEVFRSAFEAHRSYSGAVNTFRVHHTGAKEVAWRASLGALEYEYRDRFWLTLVFVPRNISSLDS